MAPETREHPREKLPPAVNNHGLFSDYYLTELVRDDPFFQESKRAAEPVWRAIKDLYDKVKGELPTANEARTEQLFIHPVLDLLGHKDSYAVQPPVDSPEGVRRPDFAFFASREDREAAASSTGRREYFTKALAVGDAKQWDRSLDRKRKGTGDAFTNANPSYQVDYYLRATDRRWGLLTNGRCWRLYHRDSSYRTDVFYEVDLVALLDGYDEAFAYFYAFFRKQALTTGFLDQALAGSRKYAAKLGDELKENVYEALRLLAEGFLKCSHNELTEDDLEEIRANTFVLIYRVLFLFYAEDRELLPMHNPVYRDSYSLRAWAREIANQLDEGRSFSPTAYHSWNKLNELFRIVDEGDAYLGVPPYNGGLFDTAKHPALARWKVGDQYLAQALDQLFRAEAAGRGGRGPVSYRDLDIRNLGSIYEGLLEHRLRLAHEDIAVTREKDSEVFVPLVKLGGRRPLKTYQAGEVYLETNKGERKATGSYYTPDYIVKYIVENTLGPLVAEKRKELEEERRDLEEKLKKSRGYDRDHYQRKLSELDQRLIQEILSIKVLDPAMGSGHFLVEAVDYLARELIKAFGETPEEMEEEEIRWARREVVERCIYGVDVNPLAVELAKLSLWIETVAKDRPLSFLDHHLRLGNSLIGAWVKDLGRLLSPGKKDKAVEIGEHVVGLFEGELKKRLPVVLGEVIELLRKPSDRVEDIRDKEAIYERILTLLQPFKEVANAWVSTYFGNEVDATGYEAALPKLSDPPAVWENEVCTQPWFEKAQEIANDRHLFHWELEFPEVFFEETGQRKRNPGFDTVIGNPPYVRQEQLKDKDFFKDRFEAYDSIADLYVYFYEIGHRLLREGGRFGMITSNKFMRAAYGNRLRRFLIEKVKPLQIIDFGDLPVFPDISAYPCIVLTVKGGEGAPPTRYLRVVTLDFESLDELVQEKASVLPLGALTEGSWQLAGADEMAILAKMEAMSVPLKDWLGDAKINYGIKTGCNEAFFIDENTLARLIAEDPKSAEIIKPLVVGEDIKRYEIDYKNRYLIWTYVGVPIDRYPAVFKHLQKYQEQLEKRWDKGDHWWELRPCDYYADFAKPKILYPVIARTNTFALDFCQLYSNDKTFIVPAATPFCLALLNSLAAFLWARAELSWLRGGFLEYRAQSMAKFPIRRIAFTTPPAERAQLVKEGKKMYREALRRGGFLP